ncbi:hypothetical protein ACFWBR_03760 [Streptomyces sp. NPDC060006]|uniref:hypothetical protein n=1 Tax=unclassified Streptomyces TaxID=2593676 RepID=UPI00363B4B16
MTYLTCSDEGYRTVLQSSTSRPRLSPADRWYDADRGWMVWRFKNDGASLFLERPYAELREGVALSVQWHQSPAPEVVAAMSLAYVRRGRRELRRPCWLVRVLRGR